MNRTEASWLYLLIALTVLGMGMRILAVVIATMFGWVHAVTCSCRRGAGS